MAGVLVGQLGEGSGSAIVSRYYTLCGRETVGPAQVMTTPPIAFSTFEDMIDKILLRGELHQVIVNHGNENFGLIIKFCDESSQSHTGPIMAKLSRLVDHMEEDLINPGEFDKQKSLMRDVSNYMKTTSDTVIRIVNKLVLVRKKLIVMHFRACNLKNQIMVKSYKDAFGSLMISFHGCRMLFLAINPAEINPNTTVSELIQRLKNTPKHRYRGFFDAKGEKPSLYIGVEDVDGHTKVRDESYIEEGRDPTMIANWAKTLLGSWNENQTFSFVIPVMWANKKLTYYTPLEEDWRKELLFV